MKKSLTILLLMLCIPIYAHAQKLAPSMHRSDSIIALLQQQFDPYHLLKVDTVTRPSLIVRTFNSPKVDRHAFNCPGFTCPNPQGIFTEQDERQWMMEDLTVGEEVLNGVINILTDIIFSKNSMKKK